MGEKNDSCESSLHVMDGINSSHDGMTAAPRKRFVKKDREVSITGLTDNIRKRVTAASCKRDYAVRKRDSGR